MAALVLAGRRNDGRLRSVSEADWEALIDVGGAPMAIRVARAVAEASEAVAVVGPAELGPLLPAGARLVPPQADLLANLERGLSIFPDEEALLVATGDAALLRAEHVLAFRRGVEAAAEADLWYSIVPRHVVEAFLPGVRRTYVRLREGSFTGGNLLALRPATFGRLKRIAERVVALRKSPLGLARLVGFGFVLRLLAGVVSLAEAERRFSALAGVRGKAVVLPYAEVGVDVDKPSDYRWCTTHLARKEEADG
jgi:molybdopterin-guanine dinucleotide biosynthesis protein A